MNILFALEIESRLIGYILIGRLVAGAYVPVYPAYGLALNALFERMASLGIPCIKLRMSCMTCMTKQPALYSA